MPTVRGVMGGLNGDNGKIKAYPTKCVFKKRVACYTLMGLLA